MAAAISRQVRRAEERRASKPAPGHIALTSRRHMAVRTKGRAFRRMILVDLVETNIGLPNTFVLRHPTRKTGEKRMSATPELLSTFFPSLPPELFRYHLGA